MRYIGYINTAEGYDCDPVTAHETAIRHGINSVQRWVDTMNADLDELLDSLDEDWNIYVPDAAIY